MIRCANLKLATLTTAILVALSQPAASEPAHGFAVLGTLKYPQGFSHFDYADPKADRGGEITLWYQGNFDSLNPFILKGHAAMGSNPFGVSGTTLTFESLMTASADEPDSYYGLVAKTVELPQDRRSVTFNIDERARFHDGSAITAEDLVFSFTTLKEQGHPVFRVIYRDITGAEATGPLQVRFSFAEGVPPRDLPAIAAGLPVLSKAWYENHEFDRTTLEAPLGSGPYRVDSVSEGRSISYRRDEGHWSRNLGVNRGRWNFRRITWDYYRDRDIGLQALFAGKLDFREDFTSLNWATKYDGVPAVEDGRLVKEVLPDESPSGFQAFYLNSRKAKFADPRVRQAIGLVFDFEWSNKNLFYGLYERAYSIFQNSDMEASGEPTAAELKLLEPWRTTLPREVFGPAFRPVRTDGSGNIRSQLRQAKKLLNEAGWQVRDGALVNGDGEAMTIEFLSYGRLFERIIAPYIANLKTLGIEASFRLVEPAQYERRVQDFDFDIVTNRSTSSLTPGVSLRSAFGSEAADVPGGRNLSGLKSEAVDALIERIIEARTRPELLTATHALDRIAMWSHNFVPQWHKPSHTVAYWDMFGRPALKPKFDLGFLDTWWVDPAKLAKLQR